MGEKLARTSSQSSRLFSSLHFKCNFTIEQFTQKHFAGNFFCLIVHMSTSGVKGSVWTSDSLQSVCTPMEVNDRDLKAQINYMEKKEEDSFMSTDKELAFISHLLTSE